MLFIAAALTIVFALGLLLVGRQFQKGKWLRLLAGNTFNELPKEKLAKTAKSCSYCLYFTSLLCLLSALALVLNNPLLLYLVCILGVIYGITGICYAFKKWLKNG
ncbi:hypothetical protein IGI37_001976 [Enterococcus sp. AZ194]|uniref:hypothetical protein n=1 Tax=Enterococcus sp. AZ194 TaxID=2774629 RepID=UPI003F287486